jgi:ribosomal protein S18 acetylase RimI-like enzyme
MSKAILILAFCAFYSFVSCAPHELVAVMQPTLIGFYTDSKGIQDVNDIPDINEMWQDCFPGSGERTKEYMKSYSKGMNLFYLVNPSTKAAVGFMEWRNTVYDRGSDKKEYAALEMYGVCIDKNERGKGYEIPLLIRSMLAMQHHFRLPGDTIIGLHLNHHDKCMPQAFALYHRLGFTLHAQFCAYGPTELSTNARILFDSERRIPLHKALETYESDAKAILKKNPNHPLYFCMFRLLQDSNYSTGLKLQQFISEVKTRK